MREQTCVSKTEVLAYTLIGAPNSYDDFMSGGLVSDSIPIACLECGDVTWNSRAWISSARGAR